MLLKCFLCYIAICSLVLSATLREKEDGGHDMEPGDCAFKKTEIELDECLREKDDKHCHMKFQQRDCDNIEDCLFGFKPDSDGCVTGCDCADEGFLEGDIMVKGKKQVKEVEEKYGIRAQSKDATTGPIWNDHCNNGICIIYYELADGITDDNKVGEGIREALKAIHDNTCIRFKKSSSENRIVYRIHHGCWSYVGKTGFNRQSISIGKGCERPGIVMHETMHALGFYHEQSRPDRDEHVEILWLNIMRRRANQFEKMTVAKANTMGSPYDENSIMHYDGLSFSRNGRPTIVDRKTGKSVNGNRDFFSEEDIAQINKLYKCPKQ